MGGMSTETLRPGDAVRVISHDVRGVGGKSLYGYEGTVRTVDVRGPWALGSGVTTVNVLVDFGIRTFFLDEIEGIG